MVGKAEIELDKIALKREEALRELANAIEVTSEKRREFEKYEEECIIIEFLLVFIPISGDIPIF